MNKLITEAEGARIESVFKYILEASESILIEHGHVITGQIIKNKKFFADNGHKDFERLEYYLSSAISSLVEDKVTEGIKDINTDENLVFKKINELSDKEKLILAECIIKHFEYSNIRGMQKAFNIFGGDK
ncbi:TPA: hypothetical protein JZF57_004747 [Escherichia coli]|nr:MULTISPECIES: hypothetical protein [Enterobacteriaceae]EKG2389078.1 hypothetical protein [Salmonella enterica]EKU2337307.1 hypothetical protein [Citrobacter freundii]HAX4801592.1 hypothetical protein [Escherichia coli]ELC6103346.1 hypothetical protein [Salmonella enterica]QLW43910.1 hypothetical protein HV229_26105 [Citrobacter sp. RHBSTW-00524]